MSATPSEATGTVMRRDRVQASDIARFVRSAVIPTAHPAECLLRSLDEA